MKGRRSHSVRAKWLRADSYPRGRHQNGVASSAHFVQRKQSEPTSLSHKNPVEIPSVEWLFIIADVRGKTHGMVEIKN